MSEHPLMAVTPAQLAVLAEALGDAIAYRDDSGETAVDDLEDHDRAAVERFRAVAADPGITNLLA